MADTAPRTDALPAAPTSAGAPPGLRRNALAVAGLGLPAFGLSATAGLLVVLPVTRPIERVFLIAFMGIALLFLCVNLLACLRLRRNLSRALSLAWLCLSVIFAAALVWSIWALLVTPHRALPRGVMLVPVAGMLYSLLSCYLHVRLAHLADPSGDHPVPAVEDAYLPPPDAP